MSNHDPAVFVLGAGFSKAAGHPLMAEFADRVIELTSNQSSLLKPEERARFQKVLDYRWQTSRVYRYLNLDLDNLENLFSIIDMESSLADSDSEARTLREDLIFVLVKTLELTLARDSTFEDAIRASKQASDSTEVRRRRSQSSNPLWQYVEFAKRLRAHDTIITFNYDTVVEDSLLASGVGPNYGFGQHEWKEVSSELPVLKLHGSVNFVSDDSGATARVIDQEFLELTTDRYYSEGVPLLIPPTWNKGALVGTMQQIWAKASAAIREASHIRFIGYSLPDTDLSFRYLLATSLSKNHDLRSVIVLDPDEETQQRYRAFISTVLATQGRFTVPGQLTFPDNMNTAFRGL